MPGSVVLLVLLVGGVVVASAGCGSRIVAGDNPDARTAAMTDDAAPNQRGPLDGGATRDGALDLKANDGPGADARTGDAGPRDAGATDTAPPVDAPVQQCAPAARRCDGKTPQLCDASGLWQNSGAACPFLCSAGACGGVCVPGTFQCTGTTRQICSPTGVWTDYLACPFVCLGTDCGGTCFPGRTRCVSGDLQTCSPTGAWQSTGVATRELLTNPSFDQGETGWRNDGVPVVYLANGNPGNGRPAVAAQSPPNLAWFGGVNRDDHQLAQDIMIPADAASVTLSFYYAILTNELTNAENDVLEVSVISASNDVVPLAHLGDNNETSDWTRFTAAVPLSLAGQTVTVQIRDVTSALLNTSFYLDTMSVEAVACP